MYYMSKGFEPGAGAPYGLKVAGGSFDPGAPQGACAYEVGGSGA